MTVYTTMSIIGNSVKNCIVNTIPTMQCSIVISRNTQSKSYMLSLSECVWEFRNNGLWDTH